MRYHAVDANTDTVLCNPNPCAQCGEPLIAARWSEHLSERCIRHVWECDACGYRFETAVGRWGRRTTAAGRLAQSGRPLNFSQKANPGSIWSKGRGRAATSGACLGG